MTNLECAVLVLASHREGRKWTDEAVSADLLAQLGLDPAGEAKNAAPIVSPDITEAEVLAHEAAAKEAVDKAHAARDALNAQAEAEAKAKAEVAADQAKAAKDARESAKEDHPPAFVAPVAHVDPVPPVVPAAHVDPVPPVVPAPLLPAEPIPFA
jgi:hypothetical protein